jgi:sigma-E factor negative regulatory protein RseA
MVMEKISAFMDGESGQTETQQAILRLRQNGECLDAWTTFHMIGDTMRGDARLGDEFLMRFHARLEQEPTQLAPRVSWRKSMNFALSAAASVSAIAIVLTLVLTDNPLRPQAQIAAAPKSAPIADAQVIARARPVAAADQGRVLEYLMAHQEYSPSTAFQGLAPYVRTVSETHDGNAR